MSTRAERRARSKPADFRVSAGQRVVAALGVEVLKHACTLRTRRVHICVQPFSTVLQSGVQFRGKQSPRQPSKRCRV